MPRRSISSVAAFELDINALLRETVEKRASDLHLQTGERPDARVYGDLKPIDPSYPLLDKEMIEKLMMPILTDAQREEFLTRWELDFSYSIDAGRFRCNYHYQDGGLGAVFRHIPAVIPTLADIQAPFAMLDFARLERGLVIVTGPTGSGKSTTLAAMLDVINDERHCHILTLEDPIEFVHPRKRALIKQREIGRDTKSFAEGLRRALRQDPDVILVGEMRDPETTAIAITAAETGHLVLSTMHTRSAPSTVDRIVDQFPPAQQAQIRTQLASSLAGVISQTLLPRSDGKGRVAAHEVLIVTSAIENIIRKGSSEQLRTPLQTQADIGMQTMDKALVYLVQQGLVELQVARRRSQELHEFDQLVEAYKKGQPVQIPKFVSENDLKRPEEGQSMQTAGIHGGSAIQSMGHSMPAAEGMCPVHHVPLSSPLLFDEATGSRYPAGTTHAFCVGRSSSEPSASAIELMPHPAQEPPPRPPLFRPATEEERQPPLVPGIDLEGPDEDEEDPPPISMRPRR